MISMQKQQMQPFTADSWNVIGRLPILRHGVLAAVLPSNEVIVVGGRNNKKELNNDVYIGSC